MNFIKVPDCIATWLGELPLYFIVHLGQHIHNDISMAHSYCVS